MPVMPRDAVLLFPWLVSFGGDTFVGASGHELFSLNILESEVEFI